jgi:hypothetical protein
MILQSMHYRVFNRSKEEGVKVEEEAAGVEGAEGVADAQEEAVDNSTLFF